MLRSDPTRPRITYYDETGSPTHGERIELSARVLANWVSKAANLLQDEWDAAPGCVVRLDLPAHWRSAYWALAVWAVGATVRLGEGDADAVVTDSPGLAGSFAADGRDAALVTLPALARRAAEVPPGVVDEAAEIANQPDVFEPRESADDDDLALLVEGAATTYAELVEPGPAKARVHVVEPDLAAYLHTCLGTWAGDGSVVLTRGSLDDAARARREASEGATAALTSDARPPATSAS